MSHKASGRKKKKIKVVYLRWFVISIDLFLCLKSSVNQIRVYFLSFFHEQDTLTAEQIAGRFFFLLIRYDH